MSNVLAERIRELAEKHGSYRAAARVLGITHEYLHRLEAGDKTNPSDETLRKLGLRRIIYLRTEGPPMSQSDTPRTDALEQRIEDVAFDRARPESHPWQFCYGGALEHARELERENARLTAELAAEKRRADEVERDAERYRHLQAELVTFADETGWYRTVGQYGVELDTAIDAALAAGKEPHE